MGIDTAKLDAFEPGASKHAGTLDKAIQYAELNTTDRLCEFLGQVCHESGHFKALSENLNYGAQGLANTWPTRFAVDPKASPKVPNAKAKAIERKPKEIANAVYANRMGNGDEASGDGFNFRGSSWLQITGKDNFRRCSIALFGDERLLANPDLLRQPDMAAMGGAWFWKANNLNALADKKDTTAISKKINGGTIGLDDRIALVQKARRAFA